MQCPHRHTCSVCVCPGVSWPQMWMNDWYSRGWPPEHWLSLWPSYPAVLYLIDSHRLLFQWNCMVWWWCGFGHWWLTSGFFFLSFFLCISLYVVVHVSHSFDIRPRQTDRQALLTIIMHQSVTTELDNLTINSLPYVQRTTFLKVQF